MTHSKRWHEDRRTGIGGSDAASVLDLPPYGCSRRLFYEKRGVEPDYPFQDNSDMERGRDLEPLISRKYRQKTGHKVLKTLAYFSKPYPFMRCNPDRMINLYTNNPGVLEIKAPGPSAMKKYQEDGAPTSWITQLHHNMYVCDVTWGAFAVFNMSEWKVEHFAVSRDDDMIKMLIEAEGKFWRAVEHGPTPERLDMGDERCGRCGWRKGCWKELVEEIEAMTGKEEEVPDFSGDEVHAEMFNIYLQSKKLVDENIASLEVMKQGIIDLMGNNPKIKIYGKSISNKPQKGKTTLDAQAIKKDYPDIWETYKQEGAPTKVFRVD